MKPQTTYSSKWSDFYLHWGNLFAPARILGALVGASIMLLVIALLGGVLIAEFTFLETEGFWASLAGEQGTDPGSPDQVSIAIGVIVLSLLLSFLTAFLGLAVLMPVIGYASWHAYRDTICADDWPNNQPE